jgi:hypothetical protein
MTTRITLTKIGEIEAGLLVGDQHPILSDFQYDIPQQYVVLSEAGEIVHQVLPWDYPYTLVKDSNGNESIVFSSEGAVPNPWRGTNQIITIPGKTNEVVDNTTDPKGKKIVLPTVDPISGWNYNTWNVQSPIKIGDYTITNVLISKLTEQSTIRYSVIAKITIVDSLGNVFGDSFVVSRSGHLLLSKGLTRDGAQEFDLIAGTENQDGAIILKKIEIL